MMFSQTLIKLAKHSLETHTFTIFAISCDYIVSHQEKLCFKVNNLNPSF